jgi:hypothetical protein
MPQSNQSNNQDKTNNQKKVESKHMHNWDFNTHYDNLIYCGQSCPCCRARVQKEYGHIEFGACKICLKN